KMERQVYELSDLDVEKEARKNKLILYQDETHIPREVEEILNNWEEQSQYKIFNAILTIAFKDRVIKYYKEFQKQLAKTEDIKINTAMTSSVDIDAYTNPTDTDNIQEIFKDYAWVTGIEKAYGDKELDEESYYENAEERATLGGSGRNSKYIERLNGTD